MGPQNVSLIIAFAAGVVSFVSPCILPVIPSYLSFLGGTTFGEAVADGRARRTVLLHTAFFVIGFSLVFLTLGLVFSSAGLLLKGVQTIIDRVAGALVVLFGLNFIFDFWKLLEIERRFHVSRRPRTVVGSVLMGITFGAGWTPCVGPILSSILFLAGTSGSLERGAVLLASYSAGLGAPFILAGVFAEKLLGYSRRLRAHMQAIKIASGAFLVVLGLLIFLGGLARLNGAFFRLAAQMEAWQQGDPLGPRLLFGLMFLALGVGVAIIHLRRRTADARQGRRAGAHPASLAITLLLLACSVLSFSGTLQIASAVSSWLRFQGV